MWYKGNQCLLTSFHNFQLIVGILFRFLGHLAMDSWLATVARFGLQEDSLRMLSTIRLVFAAITLASWRFGFATVAFGCERAMMCGFTHCVEVRRVLGIRIV